MLKGENNVYVNIAGGNISMIRSSYLSNVNKRKKDMNIYVSLKHHCNWILKISQPSIWEMSQKVTKESILYYKTKIEWFNRTLYIGNFNLVLSFARTCFSSLQTMATCFQSWHLFPQTMLQVVTGFFCNSDTNLWRWTTLLSS